MWSLREFTHTSTNEPCTIHNYKRLLRVCLIDRHSCWDHNSQMHNASTQTSAVSHLHTYMYLPCWFLSAVNWAMRDHVFTMYLYVFVCAFNQANKESNTCTSIHYLLYTDPKNMQTLTFCSIMCSTCSITKFIPQVYLLWRVIILHQAPVIKNTCTVFKLLTMKSVKSFF